jgi:NAD(P)-dependent dehydrogenase (short-subunit alcohol dehydrogenase family)
MSRSESKCETVQKAVAHFGRLHVVLNNAGSNRPLPSMNVDEHDFNIGAVATAGNKLTNTFSEAATWTDYSQVVA